jgi:hypothetical protein
MFVNLLLVRETDMFRGWIKSMIREAAREDVRESTAMERMFAHQMPAIVAFKINNGYVVQSMDTSVEAAGHRSTGFTYCKDHQAIADHIVTASAKDKLGLQPYQQEMFAKEHHHGVQLSTTSRFR